MKKLDNKDWNFPVQSYWRIMIDFTIFLDSWMESKYIPLKLLKKQASNIIGIGKWKKKLYNTIHVDEIIR